MKWFKNIFKKKDNVMAKKYDIQVFEIDSSGQKKGHMESGIMANSPQELINIYKMCGQEIQIIREYSDDESQNYGKTKHLNPDEVQINTAMGGTGMMKISEEEQKRIEDFEKMKSNNSKLQQTSSYTIPTQNKVELPKVKEPVKYFTIGGIKCKMENGKFYQKQWIRLSDEEASEIRIVSDKNNKICELKDKHIEIMKWVMTEDAEENNSDTTEERELING